MACPRLSSMTVLWRIDCQRSDATPPFNACLPVELRECSEATALAMFRAHYPDLTPTAITRVKPTPSAPASSSSRS